MDLSYGIDLCQVCVTARLNIVNTSISPNQRLSSVINFVKSIVNYCEILWKIVKNIVKYFELLWKILWIHQYLPTRDRPRPKSHKRLSRKGGEIWHFWRFCELEKYEDCHSVDFVDKDEYKTDGTMMLVTSYRQHCDDDDGGNDYVEKEDYWTKWWMLLGHRVTNEVGKRIILSTGSGSDYQIPYLQPSLSFHYHLI